MYLDDDGQRMMLDAIKEVTHNPELYTGREVKDRFTPEAVVELEAYMEFMKVDYLKDTGNLITFRPFKEEERRHDRKTFSLVKKWVMKRLKEAGLT